MRGKGGGLHPVVVLKERELSLVAGFKERGKQISGRKWWNQPGPKMKATVGGAVWFVFFAGRRANEQDEGIALASLVFKERGCCLCWLLRGRR
jgi:hypothetical protein